MVVVVVVVAAAVVVSFLLEPGGQTRPPVDNDPGPHAQIFFKRDIDQLLTGRL